MRQSSTVTGAGAALVAQGNPPRHYDYYTYYKKSGYPEEQCFKKHFYFKKKFDRKRGNRKRYYYNNNKNANPKRQRGSAPSALIPTALNSKKIEDMLCPAIDYTITG